MDDRANKSASNAQERLIAKYLGWRQVSGSGSRPNHPGDVCSESWLGECKTHINSGHRLVFKFDVWDKIELEAMSQFKLPVLFVDDGSQLIQNTYCMIQVDESVFDLTKCKICDSQSSVSFSLDAIGEFEVFKRFGKLFCVLPLLKFKEYVEISC